MEIPSPIAILGYGQEGQELEKYLKKHGVADFTVLDEKLQGKTAFSDLSGFRTVFRSPGIPYLRKEIQEARKNGAEVTSLTKLFFDLCPCPIIGVTGTKGKGTTSTLIYKMLKAAGHDVYLGGNIGYPPLEFLDQLNENGLVILELSSFQLQDLHKSPHVAVVLNVTSDHLDHHTSTEEYQSAKEAIVKFQTKDDIAIFNNDYPYKDRYASLTPAKKYFVSRNQQEYVIDWSKIGLKGAHNLENILPAITVAKLYGVPLPAIQKVLQEFTGNPHRLEFMREVDGVKYYNDSASTTPETSLAAAQAFDEPGILIAGGSEKFADYSNLASGLTKTKIRLVILMGQTADRMEKLLAVIASGAKQSLKVIRAKNLEEAIACARTQAKPGWNVILSPGAASFDMFKNYQDRGEQFKALVENLAKASS